jgi:hypothetical protein
VGRSSNRKVLPKFLPFVLLFHNFNKSRLTSNYCYLDHLVIVACGFRSNYCVYRRSAQVL